MNQSSWNERPVVFLGPSLPLEEARSLIDAEFRPPVRRGDLAILDPRRLVVIIDGEFDQSFSVSPKEILRLLDLGATVIGASSMGALRAAELGDLGMSGLGWVFAAYHSGRIVGDDEVAVTYCPFRLQALTVPLVNVRYWLGRLELAGLIDVAASARVLRRARHVFYADRTPERLDEVVATALGPERYARIRSSSLAEIDDVKAADARLALSTVARWGKFHQHQGVKRDESGESVGRFEGSHRAGPRR
jgi:hypothetical protein